MTHYKIIKRDATGYIFAGGYEIKYDIYEKFFGFRWKINTFYREERAIEVVEQLIEIEKRRKERCKR